MSERLFHQIRAVERMLRRLGAERVRVFRVRMDPEWTHPRIEVGCGPYAWTLVGSGDDARGSYADYSALVCGVELRRRVRSALHPITYGVSPCLQPITQAPTGANCHE